MLVIPAIDIIQGRVVRLHQGDFKKEKFYSDDPVETALMWQKKGAPLLHIVDLDGAKYGEIKNKDVISRIIRSLDIPCEVGGGLRDDDTIGYLLGQGAKRVVLGTVVFDDIAFLERLISTYQEKIIISVDFAGGKVVKKGWQEETNLTPDIVLSKMQEIGVKTVEITDIAMDGTLMGPRIEKLKQILDSTGISIIASGGISSLEDIKRLKELKNKNLEGVIVGRALYEGKLELEEAIKIAM